ncbi:hypothetical protein Tco_0619927 [Tanacetum coccineum]
MTDMASWMGYGIGELQFTYLGLQIGENMRQVNAWGPVVEKFKKRLADWKAKRMSFGARLTLVKSVDDRRLCDRFPRLYHLDKKKESIVIGNGSWVNDAWCWEWDWVRSIRGRVSKEFDDLLVVLQNVVVNNDCRDNWRWSLVEDGEFTVNALAKLWRIRFFTWKEEAVKRFGINWSREKLTFLCGGL